MKIISFFLSVFTFPFVLLLTLVVLIELYIDCKQQPIGTRMDFFLKNIKLYADKFLAKYKWHRYIFSALVWGFIAYLILK